MPDHSFGEGLPFSVGRWENLRGFAFMKGRRVKFPFRCQRFAGCPPQGGFSRGATRSLCGVITDVYREVGLLGKCHLFTCPRLASQGQKSLSIRISLNLLPELPPHIQVSDAAHPQLREVRKYLQF